MCTFGKVHFKILYESASYVNKINRYWISGYWYLLTVIPERKVQKVAFFLLNREEFKTEENPKYSGKVILYGLPKMRSTVTSHMSKLPLNEAWSIMRPIV